MHVGLLGNVRLRIVDLVTHLVDLVLVQLAMLVVHVTRHHLVFEVVVFELSVHNVVGDVVVAAVCLEGDVQEGPSHLDDPGLLWLQFHVALDLDESAELRDIVGESEPITVEVDLSVGT